MAEAKLESIVAHCDKLLATEEFEDYPGAVNGLQVENRGQVSKIAAAVDASLATVRKAIATGADLMVVHHGLFWGGSHPWTGKRYQLIRELLDHDLAVYSSHLPLDAHPTIGNAAGLCAALGLKSLNPFFEHKGKTLGFKGKLNLERASLAQRMAQVLGAVPTILPGGPMKCRNVGVVTGGAGAELATAASEGLDTFITGEGPHWTYALAEEAGINVFYGGHYLTETFGVRALAARLAERFKLEWCFVDHPTGL